MAAKLLGVKVEEFGLGLPPRLARLFKKGDTLYTLNWLPIGGFVRLYGEDVEGELKNKKRAFAYKPLWVKIIILLAGVTANFLLASLLFGGYYYHKGIPLPTNQSVTITGVVDASPAAKAGLKDGDKIELMYLKGGSVLVPQKPEDIVKFIGQNYNRPIHFKVRHFYSYNKSVLKDVAVKAVKVNGRPQVGIMVAPIEIKFYPWYQQLLFGVWFGLRESIAWLLMILISFKVLIANLISSHTLPAGVSGPVGIYKITANVVQTGWSNIIRFLAIISVNLAVVNLLPIPALDGGRAVLASLSSLVPSKKTRKIEYWLNLSGMAFLLLLMVLITINDVLKLR